MIMAKTKREEAWHTHFAQLQAYIQEHHQLPDKKKVENRGLLNWWKYNMKVLKQDKLDQEKKRLLQELGNSRDIHQ